MNCFSFVIARRAQPGVAFCFPFSAPQRLGSLFEGAVSRRLTEGVPAPAGAGCEMACAKIKVPARADVGIGPYAIN